MLPSFNFMRMIEDIHAEDEVKMQQSFNNYDKCSSISESIYVFSRVSCAFKNTTNTLVVWPSEKVEPQIFALP